MTVSRAAKRHENTADVHDVPSETWPPPARGPFVRDLTPAS